ncbi:MAG: LysR substrate-binding domain-containing protein [Steroidobacteraceae bacterium]
MPTPSLKFLKTFHVAAKQQSFKAAADELCITASAVSHQIKTLEDQLGLLLFERGPHSLTLTEAGAQYLDSLDSLFARIESATEQLRTRFSHNIVHLQVPPFFASELLVPRLNHFSEIYPEIDLQIATRMMPRAEHAPDADVSVIVGTGPWHDLEATCLFPQIFVPACASDLLPELRIRKAADLAAHTLIVHNARLALWDQWAAQCGLPHLKPKQLVRFDSMLEAVHAAETGLGIALVSIPLAEARFAAGTLTKVLKSEILTGESYFLVVHPEDKKRPAVRALSQWLTEQFRR